ncbi:hypothetical protein CTI14_00600 [Methylobacterium radiotolerans]|nr:hypothetical protein CTI14_00600 [Methylobacterium radiotolerans]
MTLARGWKARQEAARSKMNAPISPELAANLKLAADRLQAEREAAIALAAEEERRRLETLCMCPTCGGVGRVTVEDAAVAIAGTEHYRQRALKPDDRHYAKAKSGLTAQAPRHRRRRLPPSSR